MSEIFRFKGIERTFRLDKGRSLLLGGKRRTIELCDLAVLEFSRLELFPLALSAREKKGFRTLPIGRTQYGKHIDPIRPSREQASEHSFTGAGEPLEERLVEQKADLRAREFLLRKGALCRFAELSELLEIPIADASRELFERDKSVGRKEFIAVRMQFCRLDERLGVVVIARGEQIFLCRPRGCVETDELVERRLLRRAERLAVRRVRSASEAALRACKTSSAFISAKRRSFSPRRDFSLTAITPFV